MTRGIQLRVLAPARPPDPTLASRLETLLARADHWSLEGADERVLYGDLFRLTPTGWPVAALTRSLDADDAAEHPWLRADPAHFRVETGSVRLLACGEIGQTDSEVGQLLAALAPLFGEEGFELGAPHRLRWYLRPFAGNVVPDLPRLPAPASALGGDLFQLWPEDDVHRRWRRVFSEVQILLAGHPVNQARTRNGQPAINGLWFHGGGTLPAQVATELDVVGSDDPLLVALARAAGCPLAAIAPDALLAALSDGGRGLLDLRQSPAPDAALAALLAAWRDRRLAVLEWCSPGGRWQLRPWHALRFWRRGHRPPPGGTR